MLGFDPLSSVPLSAPASLWPVPCPVDLTNAELDSSNALVTDLVHCFPMATASSAGARDLVTGLLATTSGSVTIDPTFAGDAYRATNPVGFTPAAAVDDLEDEVTIFVIAKTQVVTGDAHFGHLFSQHPAWFLTNQDSSSGQPTRFALEVDGSEYSVGFDDAGEHVETDLLHVYVATYDGSAIRTYQDGELCNIETGVTGSITSQDAEHTRIGSYWGATDGTLVGGRAEIMVGLARRVWSATEISNFSADPWQLFVLATGTILNVADCSHGAIGDPVSLSQQHHLAPRDTVHLHSAEQPTLSQSHVITVAGALHVVSADAVILEQAHQLAVADALHAHSGAVLELSQWSTLQLAEAVHGVLSEAVLLDTATVLAVKDLLHAHSAESVALSQAHVLGVHSALHAMHGESPALQQSIALIPADALHGVEATEVLLSQAQLLSLQDAMHQISGNPVSLLQDSLLVVSDAVHRHAATQLTLGGGVFAVGDRLLAVRGHDRLLLVAPSDRLMIVRH